MAVTVFLSYLVIHIDATYVGLNPRTHQTVAVILTVMFYSGAGFAPSIFPILAIAVSLQSLVAGDLLYYTGTLRIVGPDLAQESAEVSKQPFGVQTFLECFSMEFYPPDNVKGGLYGIKLILGEKCLSNVAHHTACVHIEFSYTCILVTRI